MGKVYLKTKYDNEMKMEIPHNHNFASAMFGFREMAAEIVPYHLIDDIYDDLSSTNSLNGDNDLATNS